MRRANQRHRSKSSQPSKTVSSEPAELVIDSLSHDGRGVGRLNGKATFVSNALPGETVLAKLHNAKSKFNEADCLEVLSASTDRVEPFCEHYHTCGGCDLQHLNQQAQVSHKQTQVLEQLSRIGHLTPEETLPALQGPAQNYRRSARIGINQRADGEVIIGFRRRGSNLLTQIDNCPVLDKRLDSICASLRDALEVLPSVKHMTHLDISLGDTGGLFSVRHVKPLSDEELSIFTSMCDAYGLTLQYENSEQQSASYQVSDVCLNFHSGDFIQVNGDINQQMVDQALTLLDIQPEDNVLDLFCGLGNFSLPLARHAAQVTGVEGSDAMVEQAATNAAANDIENCRFFRANLADTIVHTQWYKGSYDKILLDPPRAGAESIIEEVCKLKAGKILYIACNPGALARDGGQLQRNGYKLSHFMLADMFPQTHHIESVALFEYDPDFKPEQQEKLLGKHSHLREDSQKKRKSSSKPVKQGLWRRR